MFHYQRRFNKICGIVGVITKNKNGFTQKEVDAFKQLLFADQLRGTDGTGVFYNKEQGGSGIGTLRIAASAGALMADKAWKGVQENIFRKSNFIIGHNRAATRGKHIIENTHPFKEKHITLVHNGTLTTQKELHDKVEVDSHAICHSMAYIGELETLKIINGAFALSWFNGKDGTLNFCRNYQRPLNIIEYTNGFIVCSEMELGLWILKRNDLTLIRQTPLVAGTLYKFDVKDMSKFTETIIDLKPYVAPIVTYGGRYEGQEYGGVWKRKEGVGEHTSSLNFSASKANFAFGQKIRFKSGFIRRTSSGTLYLEGDILKYQTLAVGKELLGDFEAQWRIKIFGTEAELRLIAGTESLEGKVVGTSIINNTCHYTVADVIELDENNVSITPTGKIVTFPSVIPKGNTIKNICEWCGAPMEKGNQMHGYEVCDTCAEPIHGSNGGYC